MDARLYLVVTPALCRGDVTATVAAALDGGVDMVQLRDKRATDDEFVALATPLARLCSERNVPFVLNDRVHLVTRVEADGAHVGEDDLPARVARSFLGPDRILGVSTHDAAEASAAAETSADYIGVGPMFATDTKQLTRAPGGPDLLTTVLRATHLPVFPIGGIDAGGARALVEVGAERLACSAAICGAADPRAAAAHLRTILAGG